MDGPMLPTHSPHRLDSVSPSRILSAALSSPRRSRLSASPSAGSLQINNNSSPIPASASSSLPSVSTPSGSSSTSSSSGLLPRRRRGLVLPDPKKLRLIIAGVVVVVLIAYLFLTRAPSRGGPRSDNSFSWSNIFPQPDRYLSDLPRPVKTDDSRTFLPAIPKRAARHVVAVHSNDPEAMAKQAEEKARRMEDERARRRESLDVNRIEQERRRFEAEAVAKAYSKHMASLSGQDPVDEEEEVVEVPRDKPRLDETCFFVRGYKGLTEMPRLLSSIATITEANPALTIDVELSTVGLWHATLEKLKQGLPGNAQYHREGPLIWAGCPGTPRHEILYLPTQAAFIKHLKDQGFIDLKLL